MKQALSQPRGSTDTRGEGGELRGEGRGHYGPRTPAPPPTWAATRPLGRGGGMIISREHVMKYVSYTTILRYSG